jgi:hypothetical protein
MKRRLVFRQRGQAIAEFALALPFFLFLMAAAYLAALYAIRGVDADVALFQRTLAAAAYPAPAEPPPTLFRDLFRETQAVAEPGARAVRGRIAWTRAFPFIWDTTAVEAHHAAFFSRLWRFYPGPPAGPWH